jgi:hypothetical protein
MMKEGEIKARGLEKVAPLAGIAADQASVVHLR